jgi:aarF domain-containing kinase
MFRKILFSAAASKKLVYGHAFRYAKGNLASTMVAGSLLVSATVARKSIAFCEIEVPTEIILPDVKIMALSPAPPVKKVQESMFAYIVRQTKEKTAEFTNNVVTAARYTQRLLVYAIFGLPLVGLLPASYTLGSAVPAVEDFTWDYMIWAIQRLGPCFIKLAQWASSRPDLFPPRLVGRLVKLQDDVEVGHSMAVVERTLAEAFGQNWKDKFVLDEKPLGAGSVAQVFRGTLKTDMQTATLDSLASISNSTANQKGTNKCSQTAHQKSTAMRRLNEAWNHSNSKATELIAAGRHVAVKIIHPHVEQLVRTDMELLSMFAWAMDQFPSLEILSLGETCRQFAEVMNIQLDLTVEAENLIKFTQKFKDDKWALFPQPIGPLIARNVLVETILEGEPISKFMDMKCEVGDSVHALKMKLSDLGCRLILKMVFFDNFVHGDLHPGKLSPSALLCSLYVV